MVDLPQEKEAISNSGGCVCPHRRNDNNNYFASMTMKKRK
jgi:hypothetical protein